MIYLVEDDESIRELVIYTLKSQGFEAKGFERPSHFWKALEKEKPALLLLDVMLPEEDGISILKKLRMRPDTRKLPIIMLTAKSSEYDTVVGLDSGVLCLLRTIFLETTYASCSGSTPASISNFVFLRIFGAFKASPSLSPTLPMKR